MGAGLGGEHLAEAVVHLGQRDAADRAHALHQIGRVDGVEAVHEDHAGGDVVGLFV